MPPKKLNQLTILKFKRLKSTYVIPIDLHLKKSVTVKNFKERLIEGIVLSGGLTINDDAEPRDIDIEDEETIPVPKSELIDEDEKVKDENVIKNMTHDDIKIAIPKDKSSPYANEWLEIINDSELEDISFNDNDIVAFRHKLDEDFVVREATYEEQ